MVMSKKPMATTASPATRNGGAWTDSRWRSFVISALRAASSKWGPKNKAKGLARVSRGVYRCALCDELGPATLRVPYKDKKKAGKLKKVNNAAVDHIKPVVDPAVGFVSWDVFIENMFCEIDNFQVICHKCHEKKTNEERAVATERRRVEKEEGK